MQFQLKCHEKNVNIGGVTPLALQLSNKYTLELIYQLADANFTQNLFHIKFTQNREPLSDLRNLPISDSDTKY